MKSSILVVTALAALAIAGCLEKRCAHDQQCANGEVCQAGACAPEGHADTPHATGSLALSGARFATVSGGARTQNGVTLAADGFEAASTLCSPDGRLCSIGALVP